MNYLLKGIIPDLPNNPEKDMIHKVCRKRRINEEE